MRAFILVLVLFKGLYFSPVYSMDAPDRGNSANKYEVLIDSTDKIVTNNPEKALEFADSGYKIAQEDGLDYYIAWFLNKRGGAHFKLGNFDSALKNFKGALKHEEKLDSINLIFKLNNNTGVIYDKMGENDSALKYYQRGLKLSRNSEDLKSLQPVIYNNLGNIYNSKGQYKTALSYYLKGINVYQELDIINPNTRRIYHNIASVHKSLDEFERAKTYYQKALTLGEDLRIIRKANIYAGLGAVYLKQDSLAKAEQYLNKSESLYKQLKNKYKLTTNYMDKARLFSKYQEYQKAFKYFDSASQLANANGYKKLVNYIALNRGITFHESGQMDKAEPELKKAIQGAKAVEDQDLLISAYEALTKVREDRGDFQEAFQALKKQNAVTTSFYDSRYKEDLEGIRTQYEMQRQQQKIQLLERENRISDLKSQKQRNLLYAMGAGLLIVIAAAGLLFKLYKEKREAHEQMKSQNEVIQQKNDELRAARKKAENTSKAKSDFLTSMSHEIRNPMNGIIGMTELLNDTNPKKEQQEYINTIRKSSETLIAVINDVLDISRAEQGKISINKAAFNLPDLINDVNNLFSKEMEEKGISLSFEIENDVPKWVEGDASRIRQILVNLVGNAKKFVAEGFIKIIVTAQGPIGKGMDEKEVIEFNVIDTGEGIEKSKRNQIFEAFNQGDSNEDINAEGLGLGLSISNKLVKIMGGTMGVKSEVGKGSTFYFSLPLRKAEKEVNKMGRNASKGTGQFDEDVAYHYPLNILVAEDSFVNQKLIKKFLEKLGYRAVYVNNGDEVIAKFRDSPNLYNLIFMDIQMPNKDGIEATKKIHEMTNPDQRPVIVALTADAMEGARDKYEDAGMDDYISKPFKAEALKAIIEQWGPVIKEKNA